MHFKNILASIAALAVASAVASPVAVEKRDGQDAELAQTIFDAAKAAKMHANDAATQEQVELWHKATTQYGSGWCSRCVAPVVNYPCDINTYYALYCYQFAPALYPVWGNSLYWDSAHGDGDVKIDHSFNDGILTGNSLDISILDNLHL